MDEIFSWVGGATVIVGALGWIGKAVWEWKAGISNTKLNTKINKELKDLDSKYENSNYVTKYLFDKEYEILTKVYSILRKMVLYFSILNTETMILLKNETEEEYRNRMIIPCSKNAVKLKQCYLKNGLSIPDDILELLEEIYNISYVIEFRYREEYIKKKKNEIISDTIYRYCELYESYDSYQLMGEINDRVDKIKVKMKSHLNKLTII